MAKRKLTQAEDLEVRQFCIKQAVDTARVMSGPGSAADLILGAARKYYNFVCDIDQPTPPQHE